MKYSNTVDCALEITLPISGKLKPFIRHFQSNTHIVRQIKAFYDSVVGGIVLHGFFLRFGVWFTCRG